MYLYRLHTMPSFDENRPLWKEKLFSRIMEEEELIGHEKGFQIGWMSLKNLITSYGLGPSLYLQLCWMVLLFVNVGKFSHYMGLFCLEPKGHYS